LDKDEDHIAAREWLDEFTVDDVPKTSYVASYARSSGAGGQHVNKTNSKAVVHMDIHKAKGDWLPRFVVPALLQSVGRAEYFAKRCAPADSLFSF
jgi:peptidyl-tRNA hydrolase ICT1